MSDKTPFPLILALWGAGLGGAAQYSKISVIFDLLPDVYPNAGAGIGLVVSLVGFVGILFGVAAGLLVARIRYRRALLGALWLGAVVSLVQALLPPLHWMLAARIIEGVSHLAIVVAAPTLIAQLSAPKDRGLTLTLWGTFFGVSFAVMAWLGRPLAIWAGLPALFVAHAAYMMFFAIYLSSRLRRLPQETAQPLFSWLQVLRDHGIIYRSPRISAASLGWLFYTFSFVSILTVLPPFLDESHRNLVMGAMPLTSIAVSMTLGVFLLRHMTAITLVELGFALSLLCTIWLWQSPGTPYGFLALAAAMGLIQGASFAAVPQLNETPATQAQANGAMAQMGNIGNTLGTPVMVAALAGMGYLAVPVLAGFAFAAGLGVHLLLGHMRKG